MAAISLDVLKDRQEHFRTDARCEYKDLANIADVNIGEAKQTTSRNPWSDAIFYERYVEGFLKEKQKRPSTERVLDVYLAFLNYYVNGNLPHNTQGVELINAVIYYLVFEGKLVFGMFMTNEVDDTLIYHAKKLQRIDPKWIMMPTTDAMEEYNYDPEKALAFYKETVARLSSQEADRMYAIHLIGHLAIKSLKLLSKDYASFEMNCFKMTMTQLVGIVNYKGVPMPPPHANLSNLKDTSHMQNDAVRESMTLATLIYCNIGAEYGIKMKSFVASACMKTLEDVGLASLKFAKLASESMRLTLCDLLDQLWFEELEKEIKIMVNGLSSTKNCSTWMVARVYDGQCLVEFSAYNIPRLSLTFALIANDEKDWPSVFSWPVLSSTLAFKKMAEEFARAIKDTGSGVSTFTPIYDSAKETQKRIMDMRKKQEEKRNQLRGTIPTALSTDIDTATRTPTVGGAIHQDAFLA